MLATLKADFESSPPNSERESIVSYEHYSAADYVAGAIKITHVKVVVCEAPRGCKRVSYDNPPKKCALLLGVLGKRQLTPL